MCEASERGILRGETAAEDHPLVTVKFHFSMSHLTRLILGWEMTRQLGLCTVSIAGDCNHTKMAFPKTLRLGD